MRRVRRVALLGVARCSCHPTPASNRTSAAPANGQRGGAGAPRRAPRRSRAPPRRRRAAPQPDSRRRGPPAASGRGAGPRRAGRGHAGAELLALRPPRRGSGEQHQPDRQRRRQIAQVEPEAERRAFGARGRQRGQHVGDRGDNRHGGEHALELAAATSARTTPSAARPRISGQSRRGARGDPGRSSGAIPRCRWRNGRWKTGPFPRAPRTSAAAELLPRQRVAGDDQVARVPEAAADQQRYPPLRRGQPAPALGGDDDDADGEGGDGDDEG